MGLIGGDDYKRINKIYPACELSIKLCGELVLNHLMLTVNGKLGSSCSCFGNIPEWVFASWLSDWENTHSWINTACETNHKTCVEGFEHLSSVDDLFVDVIFEIFNVFFKLFVLVFAITVVKAYLDLKIEWIHMPINYSCLFDLHIDEHKCDKPDNTKN